LKSETKQIKLFEIVLTVVLIAVISSVLFPYGIGFYERAQLSGFNATYASFSSALQSIHNKWLLTKTNTILFELGNKESVEILVNKHGWPLAVLTRENVPQNLNEKLQCADLWRTLLSNPPTLSLEMSRQSQYWLQEETTECRYAYTELKEQNVIVYDSNSGQVFLE